MFSDFLKVRIVLNVHNKISIRDTATLNYVNYCHLGPKSSDPSKSVSNLEQYKIWRFKEEELSEFPHMKLGPNNSYWPTSLRN